MFESLDNMNAGGGGGGGGGETLEDTDEENLRGDIIELNPADYEAAMNGGTASAAVDHHHQIVKRMRFNDNYPSIIRVEGGVMDHFKHENLSSEMGHSLAATTTTTTTLCSQMMDVSQETTRKFHQHKLVDGNGFQFQNIKKITKIQSVRELPGGFQFRLNGQQQQDQQQPNMIVQTISAAASSKVSAAAQASSKVVTTQLAKVSPQYQQQQSHHQMQDVQQRQQQQSRVNGCGSGGGGGLVKGGGGGGSGNAITRRKLQLVNRIGCLGLSAEGLL